MCKVVYLGKKGDQIQITAQELPQDLDDLMALGVRLNACSLNQLDHFGQLAPGGELSVRINPGLGSGHSQRTNVGGPSASFGIWHAYLDQVKAIAAKMECTRQVDIVRKILSIPIICLPDEKGRA